MITLQVNKRYHDTYTDRILQQVEIACLSSDTKPTTGIANGSTLFEMDTKTLYFFDEENETWRAWA